MQGKKAHTGFEQPCKSAFPSAEVGTGVGTVRARPSRLALREEVVDAVRRRAEGICPGSIEVCEEGLEPEAAVAHERRELRGLPISQFRAPRSEVRHLRVNAVALCPRKEAFRLPGLDPVHGACVVVLSARALAQELIEQPKVDEHGFEQGLPVLVIAIPASTKGSELRDEHAHFVGDVPGGVAV
jgi:hypothetical protein